jgi:non-specific serine/threonine protein kinase
VDRDEAAGQDDEKRGATTGTGGRLSLILFGPFDARLGEEPLPRPRTRKGEWLLALLTLRHGRDVERSWLAGTLWPDSPEQQAYASLRQALADLRRVLGPEARRLQSPSPQRVRFDLAGAGADVVAFDAEIQRAEPASLEAAVARYRGPFLEGCAEEWVFQERQAREQAFLGALERLATDAMARGASARAVDCLRRAVAVDPLRETAQRALMGALAAAGNYAAAGMTYRDLRLHLHRELNAEPAPETAALYEEIRAQARQRAADSSVGMAGIVGGSGSGALPVERRSDLLPTHNPSSTPSLAPQPPPVHALRKGWLPQPLTPFVGREREVLAVQGCLAAARLVTLTGSGGVGKTRLALEAARRLESDYRDGAWFVDLAPLSESALVPQAIAAALGLPEQPGRAVEAALAEHLHPRELLLVLDNCEHLVEVSARLVDALLRQCPRLRVLATSRQALGLIGETAWRVPSLPVPEDGGWMRIDGPDGPAPGAPTAGRSQPATLDQYPSVQLFVQRAQAARPGFALTERNAPAVAQLCRRLDGIPLALELAAARVRVLGIEQIAARLDDRFRLLTGGSRTSLPRQQTLQAAFEWSYTLLTAPEQLLLQRLSVFAGRFTLADAEAVCGDASIGVCASARGAGGGSEIRKHDVLDLLASLVEKSLVSLSEAEAAAPLPEARTAAGSSEPELRYRLLETTREYVRGLLTNSGEEELRWRHAAWFLELVEETFAMQEGPQLRQALDQYDAAHDNLRAALDFCLSAAEAAVAGEADGRRPETGGESASAGIGPEALDPQDAATRLAGALARFWDMRGYHAEGRLWLTRVLALPSTPSRSRVRALLGAGNLQHLGGNRDAARAYLAEAIAMSRTLGDGIAIARCVRFAGLLAQEEGNFSAARQHYQEALIIVRAEGAPHWEEARLLRSLGALALDEGDLDGARQSLEESLAIWRRLHNPLGVVSALMMLGHTALAQGDYVTGQACHEETVQLCEEISSTPTIAWCYGNLADVVLADNRIAEAEALYLQSLQLHAPLDSLLGVAEVLRGLGAAAATWLSHPEATWPAGSSAAGLGTRTARLFGAHDAIRARLRIPLTRFWQEHYESCAAHARRALGEEAYLAAWTAGRDLPLEQTIHYALGDPQPSPTAS